MAAFSYFWKKCVHARLSASDFPYFGLITENAVANRWLAFWPRISTEGLILKTL
jgi:hypothetical protein